NTVERHGSGAHGQRQGVWLFDNLALRVEHFENALHACDRPGRIGTSTADLTTWIVQNTKIGQEDDQAAEGHPGMNLSENLVSIRAVAAVREDGRHPQPKDRSDADAVQGHLPLQPIPGSMTVGGGLTESPNFVAFASEGLDEFDGTQRSVEGRGEIAF